MLLQLERAGQIEAGTGGEGLPTVNDPQLLMTVMEAREAIDEAEVTPRPCRPLFGWNQVAQAWVQAAMSAHLLTCFSPPMLTTMHHLQDESALTEVRDTYEKEEARLLRVRSIMLFCIIDCACTRLLTALCTGAPSAHMHPVHTRARGGGEVGRSSVLYVSQCRTLRCEGLDVVASVAFHMYPG